MNSNTNYKLSGRVDGTNADQYEHEISVLLDHVDQTFTIDLSELDYISSIGLRVFLKTAKMLKERHKKLILANPKTAIHELLLMSGFDKIIDIELERK